MIAAGTPIITLIDLSALYLRGFIPDLKIGNVKVGQKAKVWIDSIDQGTKKRIELEAEVIRIDPQASFTPENTYFRDDRVKQVFGVELPAERQS